MKIHIQTLDFTPRQSLLDLVNEKVGKLEKFSDRIIESRVTLRVEKSEKRDNKICEVRVVIPGNDLFVKKQSESFEDAVQRVTETLERQLKDWKEKIRG
ncbi:MAG: ribosome-associated translation inhibitor RaiA [Cyclobacteriaceae bacterium]|nr:ribosome-associated translation inhibitor RaiA [Cyclobacteriaceae bacterium]MCX7638240.1 ribosome-associated translation inhibitor RaiA [Cyclobacteriaceae bacterium]MDW8331712.1 ribosome-associated translation inhibitor RaiA [Cyclobacteriaceae bacterium]